MPAFLQRLTAHIYKEHHDHLGEICIVLPNRRAALFIRKHLAEMLEKTSFLPEYYSIEDFVHESLGSTPADPLAMQFMLYELHRNIAGEQARSIDYFLPYANWMLSDFNEIDMYLADPGQVFSYLSDARAMSLWSPDGKSLSEMEKDYLAFYRSLDRYYKGLHRKLHDQQLAYQGMAFRKLAEEADQLLPGKRWRKVIFAGFNALTPSEETIMEFLVKHDKAEIFWDADQYYTSNKRQEAGLFLRKYLASEHLKGNGWTEDHFRQGKNISIIGVPGTTGQVKYAGEILQKIFLKKGSLDNTALVLPDENLLIPLLNSIPREAGKFNVTMGLSLRNTPLFHLFDSILSMLRNTASTSEFHNTDKAKYYSRDLIRIFNHPWFAELGDERHEIPDRIRLNGAFFLPLEGLLELLPDAHIIQEKPSLLFPPTNDPKAVLSSFAELIACFRKFRIEQEHEENNKIELEYIFQFSTLIKRLDDLLTRYGSIDEVKTLQLIFRQLASQLRIPFFGEPLAGLQVMGVLETRTLDFETVIMLSVNEGTIPSGKMNNSFIPFDIKNNFGLPTYRHNNAVFAYHFYRLLQRAGQTYLLYNTEAGNLGGEEKSRFITQLQQEVKKYKPGITIEEKLLSMPPPIESRDLSIRIEKDQEVMELFRREAEHGFHPSSLSKFINCPLQFYFARLMRIEETDEIGETIDNRILGIVVHESLRQLYLPALTKTISGEFLSSMSDALEGELDRQFRKEYQGGTMNQGKNYLIRHVAEKMLKQLIGREKAELSKAHHIVIRGLEEKIGNSLDAAGQTFSLGGTVDRIDEEDGVLRIIDYKTGYVDEPKLRPKSWEELSGDPKHSQAFQLLMYSWLYMKKHPGIQSLKAGIISLRTPGKGLMEVKPPGYGLIDREAVSEFEMHLIDLLKKIADPDIPFVQTSDTEACRYCNFKEICNRIIPEKNF